MSPRRPCLHWADLVISDEPLAFFTDDELHACWEGAQESAWQAERETGDKAHPRVEGAEIAAALISNELDRRADQTAHERIEEGAQHGRPPSRMTDKTPYGLG